MKRQVRAMFEEERPLPLPLPTTRFEYYRICQRTVHFDGYIEADSAYYSAPPRWVGRKVIVRIRRLWLRIRDPTRHECIREFCHQKRAAAHQRRRSLQTDAAASGKVAARIAGAGPGCGAFARRLCRGARCPCNARAL